MGQADEKPQVLGRGQVRMFFGESNGQYYQFSIKPAVPVELKTVGVRRGLNLIQCSDFYLALQIAELILDADDVAYVNIWGRAEDGQIHPMGGLSREPVAALPIMPWIRTGPPRKKPKGE